MNIKDKLKTLFEFQKFEENPKLNQTIIDSLRNESYFEKEKYMVNLKENELGAVVGGVRDGQLEGGPANYQYKASVKYSGYTAKSEPSDAASDVCKLDQYAIVYVMEVVDGTKYVKCQFKGDSHRMEGFIRSDILEVIK